MIIDSIIYHISTHDVTVVVSICPELFRQTSEFVTVVARTVPIMCWLIIEF